ncbi:MAG: glycosyltransferase [Eubacteriales bacterium]|nr:glycosyltransferase [Eubacteriales bacterium]
MKIFIITPVFPNSINNRSGSFVLEQAEILMNMGHEVIVLDAGEYSYKHWLDNSLYNAHFYTIDKINVIALHTHGLMRTRLSRLYVNLYSKKLKYIFNLAIKKYGNPDVIYAHFTFPSGFAACVLGNKFNIPVVVLEHGTLFLNKINNHITSLLIYTLKNSYKYFAVSPELVESLNKKSDNIGDIKILNNVINNSYSYYPRVKKENFVFFSAGNFYSHKGFVELINAFKIAFKDQQTIKLRIAGNGPELENIKKAINNDNRIELIGVLNREEMIDEYKNCDAFALASKLETFGMVYREALAIGRPVISYDNVGIKYLWSDKYGYIAKSENELVECFESMYKSIDKFDNKFISRNILNDFGESNFINKWLEIQNNLRK